LTSKWKARSIGPRPTNGVMGMQGVLRLAAAAVLVAACTGPTATVSRTATIDEARAGQIARDYFATAHGTGIKLTDVRETDLGMTNDTACGSAWEVLMEGTVTESTGASYGSDMYLCVDPTSGAVTRGPAG
jgi:hypothetical protein